jgi:uncharacterized lipoprotein YajG
MKKLIVVVAMLMLGGCAFTTPLNTSPGFSKYKYEKINKDGSSVKVTITSGRDALGAGITIKPNGELVANADLTGAEQQRMMMQTMQQMLLLMQPALSQYFNQTATQK